MMEASANLEAVSDASIGRGGRVLPNLLHYRGAILLDALDGSVHAPPVTTVGEDWRTLRLPGIDFAWRASCVDVAVKDSVVALATGRASDARASAGRGGEAARWIERYAARGTLAADGIGGGFAVAIVDMRERKAVLLVDRFSIESMCYAEGRQTIVFADTACDAAGTEGKIDPQSIYDYLYFHVIPAPYTAFRGVRRLPPGHRFVGSASGVELQPYWRPAFVENDARDLAGRMRRFVELVEHSVRTEAEEPSTACFLSGGTDSSTIAGMLTRVRGQPAHAYSIGFEAEGYDEMAYARIAASHFGLVHREYYVTPGDLVAAIPAIGAAMDQPFGNSSLVPAYFCALRAREDGFAKMLAGDGGDELFGGNARYATQVLFDAYRWLPVGIRRTLEKPATQWKTFRSVPLLKQLGGYVRHARVPMPDRMHTFNLLHRLERDGLLAPTFRASIDPERPLRQQRATWNALPTSSVVNGMLAYDWKFTLADNDLPKVRMATQFAGVAVGFPFLDRELTDFSLALPPKWKVRHLRLRWFFKRALRDFLPDEILRKKKHGFGLPFGPWLLRHVPLRRLAQESLEGITGRGIVDADFTRDLLAKHLVEAPGYYGEMVWILMMLEQWMRSHDVN